MNSIVYIAILMFWALCHAFDPLKRKWEQSFYRGHRARSILKLYYNQTIPKNNWWNQPEYCYGVLVDWRMGLFPCSCVYYDKRDQVRSPFDHPPIKQLKEHVDPTHLIIGLMWDEFWIDQKERKRGRQVLDMRNKTRIGYLAKAPGCDNSFHLDFVVIILNHELPRSRLAFFHTAEPVIFKWSINRVESAGLMGGHCEVVAWRPHIRPINQNSRITTKQARTCSASKNLEERYDADCNKWVLETHKVWFDSWYSCMHNVCPSKNYFNKDYYPQPKYGVDLKDCNNWIGVTRKCAEWREPDSLCALPRGTPVFCDFGKIQGVIGFLDGAAHYCSENIPVPEKHAVMLGFDNAISGIHDALRVTKHPDYEKSIPKRIKKMRPKVLTSWLGVKEMQQIASRAALPTLNPTLWITLIWVMVVSSSVKKEFPFDG